MYMYVPKWLATGSSFVVPAEGHGAARRGAWEGERGGGARRGARGESPKRLYKAPADYTKPQQTIQSPEKTNKHGGNIKMEVSTKYLFVL